MKFFPTRFRVEVSGVLRLFVGEGQPALYFTVSALFTTGLFLTVENKMKKRKFFTFFIVLSTFSRHNFEIIERFY